MASLKAMAACIGIAGDFRVVRNFFGYASAPPWSLAPAGQQASLPQSLSVLTQVKRLQQRHVHLDCVRVGTGSNGLLAAVDEQNLDCAVQMARDIFGAAGIGIGRYDRWWMIPLSDNTGYDVIDDDCEASDLVDEFDAPGGGIDVFFVLSYAGSTAGLYPWKGDGVVVESREMTFLGTARTFSHELGHYLGLGHENDKPNNLMCQSSQANPMPGSTQLNSGQISDIKDHDDTTGAC
jgi:hypothetical protein